MQLIVEDGRIQRRFTTQKECDYFVRVVEHLGAAYSINFDDYSIYRDLRNGFRVEINNACNKEDFFIYVMDLEKNLYYEHQIVEIFYVKNFRYLKIVMDFFSEKYRLRIF